MSGGDSIYRNPVRFYWLSQEKGKLIKGAVGAEFKFSLSWERNNYLRLLGLVGRTETRIPGLCLRSPVTKQILPRFLRLSSRIWITEWGGGLGWWGGGEETERWILEEGPIGCSWKSGCWICWERRLWCIEKHPSPNSTIIPEFIPSEGWYRLSLWRILEGQRPSSEVKRSNWIFLKTTPPFSQFLLI